MPNLFRNIPQHLPRELIEPLVVAEKVRIERILSHGQASPADFWYDQEEAEWVLLLQGAARLAFRDRTVDLKPGDYVHIPAHQPHRVDWTTPDATTIWLAIFYR
jgi:cupin 2 domain-containing protein